MKTSILAIIALVFTALPLCSCGSSDTNKDFENYLSKEIQELEKLAQNGDTTAIHRLLNFYDENCPVTLCVDFQIPEDCLEEDDAPDGQEITNTAKEEFYNQRLNYWLDKGLAVKDPVATFITGMRLYYTDEEAALKYLIQATEMGNSKAALFCGSAYYNLGKGQEAIKYFTIADELGQPSAGWHLAQCYRGYAGVDRNPEKAMQYLVKSGMKDYPEAVLELLSIDPENPVWKQKAKSLGLEYPEQEIVTDVQLIDE